MAFLKIDFSYIEVVYEELFTEQNIILPLLYTLIHFNPKVTFYADYSSLYYTYYEYLCIWGNGL